MSLKKTLPVLFIILVLLLSTVSVSAAENNESIVTPISDVTATETDTNSVASEVCTEIKLGVGEKYSLYELLNITQESEITYSSDSEEIVSVSNNGEITALSVGTAIVSVSVDNQIQTLKVTVKDAPDSIKLSVNKLTLGVGEEYIIYQSSPKNTYAKNFTFTSDNPSVATIEKTTANKARIVAHSVGTATISVQTYNGMTDSCTLTVKEAPTSVKLSTNKLTLGAGEEFIISQSSPAGTYAKSFEFTSDNNSVATIEKTTANKAKIVAKSVGTATITVQTYNGNYDTCVVSVKNAPTSVKMSQMTLSLAKGDNYIVSQSSPSGTYAKGFTFTSDNPGVASVEKTTANKAKVTAKKAGTANITVKTYNGKTSTCKVTVGQNFAMRTTTPSVSNLNYRPKNLGGYNPFTGSLSMFPSVHGRGSGRGNCTAYAWGRVCEVYGVSTANKLPKSSAGAWYYNWSGAKGSTPKPGAVAVWSGHVAFVENVNGNTITISESGYTSCVFRVKTGSVYSMGYYGNFIGYIYP